MRERILRHGLRLLGSVLILGGLAHFFGVGRLYSASGVPEANRVLLDVWIGEAQLLGGVTYWIAARALQRGAPFCVLVVLGALFVAQWALPFLPVLVRRAAPHFVVAPSLYLIVSFVLVGLACTGRPRSVTLDSPRA